jgi:hypothetical protein
MPVPEGAELADMVVHRLFRTGLVLQSAAALVADDAVAVRLEQTVRELDDLIRDVRAVVFAASAWPEPCDGQDKVIAVPSARPGGQRTRTAAGEWWASW